MFSISGRIGLRPNVEVAGVPEKSLHIHESPRWPTFICVRYFRVLHGNTVHQHKSSTTVPKAKSCITQPFDGVSCPPKEPSASVDQAATIRVI